eukprot:gene36874-biopygen29150
MRVGPMEGLAVLVTGLVVGPLLLGLHDGDAVGEAEGGILVGEKLLDGLALGLFEGREDGFFFGDLVEDTDGSKLGTSVGSIEDGTVGALVVFVVGISIFALLFEGRLEIFAVGYLDCPARLTLGNAVVSEINLVGVNVAADEGPLLGMQVDGTTMRDLVGLIVDLAEEGFGFVLGKKEGRIVEDLVGVLDNATDGTEDGILLGLQVDELVGDL